MLGKILQKILNVSDRNLSEAEKQQNLTVKAWFRDKGDQTHRLNYPLTASSVVMDLGGYEGEWTSDIFKRYGSFVLVFEPHVPFYQKIAIRFKSNPKISAYPFGIGMRTEKVQFSIDDNASAIVKNHDTGSQHEQVQLVNINEFLEQQKITVVDLIKINIEGGEYELLEQMLQSGIIERFKNIQVQFHNFVPNAKERMKQIQQALKMTHELTYQYEFVWENWRLKNEDYVSIASLESAS